MPILTVKRFEQIVSEMLSYIVTRTNLSDISDTSVLKHLVGAAAYQIDELFYQLTILKKLFSIDDSTGEDLDARAKDIQPGLITRNLATKATGNVVFSRSSGTGTIIIPSNTKIKTASGQVFTTTVAGTITDTSPEQIPGHGVGKDSDLVAIVADVAGSAGEVSANTIIKFVQKPVGVDSVTNPAACINGNDLETDASFRNRIKRYIASLARSTLQALENAVLGAQDETTGASILFAKAVEDSINRGYVTIYIDDGTGSIEDTETVASENVCEGLAGPPADSAVGGESYLFLDYKPIKDTEPITITSSTRGVLVENTDYYLNSASGQINFTPVLTAGEVITADYTKYVGLIALAQKIIDGDITDKTNYPGYRAGGVLVYVRSPQILVQTIEMSVVVLEGYNDSTVKANIKQAIKNYINSLGISGDVLRSELIKRAMSIAGTYNVNLVTPTTDIILLDDQMARATDVNITIN